MGKMAELDHRLSMFLSDLREKFSDMKELSDELNEGDLFSESVVPESAELPSTSVDFLARCSTKTASKKLARIWCKDLFSC